MASELKTLIDSNTVRVFDLVVLTKADDGSVEATELRDADDSEIGEPRALERDLAILLAEEDIEEIGETLDPGSAAVVLVWENAWAAPFGSAVRRSGGELLGSGRIPTQASSRRCKPTAKPQRKDVMSSPSDPTCRDLLSSSAERVRAGCLTVELEEAPDDDRNGT